jgi:hypothetical protein
MKDDVRNANDYGILESQSVQSDSLKTEFLKAKKLTEDYKVPLSYTWIKRSHPTAYLLHSMPFTRSGRKMLNW